MPYIAEDDRKILDKAIQTIVDRTRLIVARDEQGAPDGICNYVISRIVAASMKPDRGWRYWTLGRALLVFEAAKLEFYRRLVAPYEDKAKLKNGDIPEYRDSDIPA